MARLTKFCRNWLIRSECHFNIHPPFGPWWLVVGSLLRGPGFDSRFLQSVLRTSTVSWFVSEIGMNCNFGRYEVPLMLVAAVVVVAAVVAVLVVVFVATVIVSFSRYFKLHVLCSGRDRFGPFEMRQTSKAPALAPAASGKIPEKFFNDDNEASKVVPWLCTIH